MVYLIEMKGQGLCKIGHSVDPVARMAGMQTASPHELVLLGVMRGGPAKEAELHGLFDAQRVKGEWFHVSDELTNLFSPPEEVEYEAHEKRPATRTNGYTYLLALSAKKGRVVSHADITGMDDTAIMVVLTKIAKQAWPKRLIFCTEQSDVPRSGFVGGDAFRRPYPPFSFTHQLDDE